MRCLVSFLFLVCLGNCLADAPESSKPKTRCMWIGCSASKSVAGQGLGLKPDELCVHINLANLFKDQDPSAQSTLKHAVEVEKVTQIIVCGTYGCPGIQKALDTDNLQESWLQSVRELYLKNKAELHAIQDQSARARRLVELNVLQQVETLCQHPLCKSIAIIGVVHDPATNSYTKLRS